MGLNAIVYKTAAETGESLPAIHKRLGNASMVSWIANQVSSLDAETSILSDKVLYSGSHSGDSIDVEDLDELQDEINIIREKTEKTKNEALKTFLEDMTELIKTAKEQQTPIVFV